MQESGILLSQPWTEESDTIGKAVSFFEIGGYLAQLLVALFLGPLINMFETTNTIMVVSCVGMALATLCCWNVVTKESPRWTSKLNFCSAIFQKFTRN